jgi:hypothetical protein
MRRVASGQLFSYAQKKQIGANRAPITRKGQRNGAPNIKNCAAVDSVYGSHYFGLRAGE